MQFQFKNIARLAALVLGAALLAPLTVHAQSVTVLKVFSPFSPNTTFDNNDGANPSPNVIVGNDGLLYGTASNGAPLGTCGFYNLNPVPTNSTFPYNLLDQFFLDIPDEDTARNTLYAGRLQPTPYDFNVNHNTAVPFNPDTHFWGLSVYKSFTGSALWSQDRTGDPIVINAAPFSNTDYSHMWFNGDIGYANGNLFAWDFGTVFNTAANPPESPFATIAAIPNVVGNLIIQGQMGLDGVVTIIGETSSGGANGKGFIFSIKYHYAQSVAPTGTSTTWTYTDHSVEAMKDLHDFDSSPTDAQGPGYSLFQTPNGIFGDGQGPGGSVDIFAFDTSGLYGIFSTLPGYVHGNVQNAFLYTDPNAPSNDPNAGKYIYGLLDVTADGNNQDFVNVDPHGIVTVLHHFTGGDTPVHGALNRAPAIIVSPLDNNFYGLTCTASDSIDTLFSISPGLVANYSTPVPQFNPASDGIDPGDMTLDSSGNFYLAMREGGPSLLQDNQNLNAAGSGTILAFQQLATTSISPNSKVAGSPAFTLTVNGKGFVNGGTPSTSSEIEWNGAPLTTTYVSSSELTATIPANLIASVGTASVSVQDPSEGPTVGLPFAIMPQTPVLLSISPTSAPAGGPSFTLTANGQNFNNTQKIDWNGTPLSTTFVSATQLTATVPASDIANPGTVIVTVTDPISGSSGSATFTITGFHIFPSGLQLISSPFDYSGQTFASILDNSGRFAIWDPVNDFYDIGPGAAPLDTFHQGLGYWARFTVSTTLKNQGTDITSGGSVPFDFDLSPGWNMIGDPLNTAFPIANLQVEAIGVGNTPILYNNLNDAVAAGVLMPTLFSYNPSTNAYVANAPGATNAESLQPWVGYWIKVNQPCTLIVP